MVFDGIFSFAGNDDDVLDSGGDALFGDVLNLRLVDDGEHFFRLRLGGGEGRRAESRGRGAGVAELVSGSRGGAAVRPVWGVPKRVGRGRRFLTTLGGRAPFSVGGRGE